MAMTGTAGRDFGVAKEDCEQTHVATGCSRPINQYVSTCACGTLSLQLRELLPVAKQGEQYEVLKIAYGSSKIMVAVLDIVAVPSLVVELVHKWTPECFVTSHWNFTATSSRATSLRGRATSKNNRSTRRM